MSVLPPPWRARARREPVQPLRALLHDRTVGRNRGRALMAGQYQTKEVEAYVDGDALRFAVHGEAWISAKNPVEIEP